jgi:hypothetical protein
MIEQDLAVVPSVREVELEDVLGPERDVPPEFVPLLQAHVDRIPKGLGEARHVRELALGGVMRLLRSGHLQLQLLNGGALPVETPSEIERRQSLA